MAKKLTKQFIESIKPHSTRDIWITDTAVRNLRLKITPKGAKSYTFDYYNRLGEQ